MLSGNQGNQLLTMGRRDLMATIYRALLWLAIVMAILLARATSSQGQI